MNVPPLMTMTVQLVYIINSKQHVLSGEVR